METWFITGGAGFIGSNFVRLAMEKSQANLVILDALTYAGNLGNLSDLLDHERFTFERVDICEYEKVDQLFAKYKPQKVIHFAAESHVDRSILGPKDFLKTNIDGTYTLLEAIRKHWTEKLEEKCFLHVSTDEVYGTLGPNDPAFHEGTPYQPTSPYSASKAASDHLVNAWHLTYGMPTVISNCSNNYGPWQFPEKLIPLFTLNAIENKALPVYGDGLQIRDWLHVSDHCEALFLLLEKGRKGETYVIGGDNEQTNLFIIQKICEKVDLRLNRPKGTSAKLIEHVKDRAGHDRRYAIDASKIKNELGWKPKRSFEQALEEVVQWYFENQDWAASIRSGEYLDFYKKQYTER